MNNLEKFNEIHTFVFDVDGVMTNSNLLILEDGKLLRQMSIRDGFALKHAIQQDYKICVISGGSSEGVRYRLKSLGVTDIYTGRDDKLAAFEEYLYAYDLNPDEVLYMGDDLPDIEVLWKVGLPTCPADAAPEVMRIVKYISPKRGGEGCVRDVIEKVLRLHGKWPKGEGGSGR